MYPTVKKRFSSKYVKIKDVSVAYFPIADNKYRVESPKILLVNGTLVTVSGSAPIKIA